MHPHSKYEPIPCSHFSYRGEGTVSFRYFWTSHKSVTFTRRILAFCSHQTNMLLLYPPGYSQLELWWWIIALHRFKESPDRWKILGYSIFYFEYMHMRSKYEPFPCSHFSYRGGTVAFRQFRISHKSVTFTRRILAFCSYQTNMLLLYPPGYTQLELW